MRRANKALVKLQANHTRAHVSCFFFFAIFHPAAAAPPQAGGGEVHDGKVESRASLYSRHPHRSDHGPVSVCVCVRVCERASDWEVQTFLMSVEIEIRDVFVWGHKRLSVLSGHLWEVNNNKSSLLSFPPSLYSFHSDLLCVCVSKHVGRRAELRRFPKQSRCDEKPLSASVKGWMDAVCVSSVCLCDDMRTHTQVISFHCLEALRPLSQVKKTRLGAIKQLCTSLPLPGPCLTFFFKNTDEGS